jgi:intergrase/recombinase
LLEKFIQENIQRDIKSSETTDDLYKRYRKFCRFHEVEAVSRRKFAYEIRKLNVGIKDGRKNIPTRWGVKLLPCKY